MNVGRLTSQERGQVLKDQALEGRMFASRAMTAFLLVLFAVLMLCLRYFYLQVISHDEFSVRSASNRVRVVPVAPNRGLVYDRRGRPVAQNLPAYRLQVVPEKVENLDETMLELGS